MVTIGLWVGQLWVERSYRGIGRNADASLAVALHAICPYWPG